MRRLPTKILTTTSSQSIYRMSRLLKSDELFALTLTIT